MSGARNRRFPRTARAIPDPAPKIEREKIRHRRPNDMMFDEEPPYQAQDAPTLESVDDVVFGDDDEAYVGDGDDGYVETTYGDEPEADWKAPDDPAPETSEWDYEPEGDWVLDSDGGPAAPGPEEDSGVVWEDDGYDEQLVVDDPDEVTFGEASTGSSPVPEVELAGRRDVRPKPPKPAPSPRAKAQRQPASIQQAPGQQSARQQAPRQRPQSRGDRAGWAPPGSERETLSPPPRARTAEPPPRQQQSPSFAPMDAESGDNGRFSRTRATLGVADDSANTEVLQQPRRGPSQRRRQAQSPPAALRNTAKRTPLPRSGSISGMGLIKVAAVLVLLAAGGWFAYQNVTAEDVQPMLDRVTSLLPLPGTGRTADDTSFGNQASTVSPEQALADLEQRQSVDAAAAPSDGPPIPKFKPLPGATRSLSADAGTGAVDESQLAGGRGGGDKDAGGEPSILEQIRRYFSPG